MGWSGLRNGDLLKKAEDEFDFFLTADSNLTFQQNLSKFDLAVIVLEPQSTRLVDTLPLMSQVLELLETIKPKVVVRVRPKTSG